MPSAYKHKQYVDVTGWFEHEDIACFHNKLSIPFAWTPSEFNLSWHVCSSTMDHWLTHCVQVIAIGLYTRLTPTVRFLSLPLKVKRSLCLGLKRDFPQYFFRSDFAIQLFAYCLPCGRGQCTLKPILRKM